MKSKSGRPTWLAIDLGAESGRGIIGYFDNHKLRAREIHRFPNPKPQINGHQHWDFNYLYSEVLKCLQVTSASYNDPLTSVAIDSWGVDFGLLDAGGQLLTLPFIYRDRISTGAMSAFGKKMAPRKLYELTGIQFLPFNSVFQLYALKQHCASLLESARNLLFIPDILNYLLTGRRATEFTFATTAQLFNPRTKEWEKKIFRALDIPIDIMQRIIPSASVIGIMKPSVANSCNCLDLPVVAVGSHDTASAVAAVPAQGRNWAFISSGTWSCMGVEIAQPTITPQTLRHNFTNEGGVGDRYRFLKNIAGLWLIQQCRKEWIKTKEYSYADLMELARNAQPFKSLIDPDAPEFVLPECMPDAINHYLRKARQKLLSTPSEFTRCILESLALKYRFVYHQLQQTYPFSIDRIHIIGGGAKNHLLCQFAANAIGIPVTAGPAEATSVGNLMVQAMASGHVNSLDEIREVVRNSFNIMTYYPQDTPLWNGAYRRFLDIINEGD